MTLSHPNSVSCSCSCAKRHTRTHTRTHTHTHTHTVHSIDISAMFCTRLMLHWLLCVSEWTQSRASLMRQLTTDMRCQKISGFGQIFIYLIININLIVHIRQRVGADTQKCVSVCAVASVSHLFLYSWLQFAFLCVHFDSRLRAYPKRCVCVFRTSLACVWVCTCTRVHVLKGPLWPFHDSRAK